MYCTCSIQPSWLPTSLKIVTVSCTPKIKKIRFFYSKNGYNGASMLHASNNPLLQRTFFLELDPNS